MDMPPLAPASFVDYVNPLQGTASAKSFSRGNCLPLIALPFGMTHWSPQTAEERGGWFFHPDDHVFQGIRATHQPSPWMGDYGHFVLMPQTGPLLTRAAHRASGYRPDCAVFQPHYFRADLLRYNCTVELTPTERGAALRCTFDAAGSDTLPRPTRLLLSLFDGAAHYIDVSPSHRQIVGYTCARTGGTPENYALYFVVEFDTPLVRWGVFDSDTAMPGETRHDSDRKGGGAYVEFGNTERDTPLVVEARIATSFISQEQAAYNLAREIGSEEAVFDTVKAQAEARWNDLLGRVTIDGATERQRRTWYTCLWRTQLFPRMFHEPVPDSSSNKTSSTTAGGSENGDKTGVHHYSPYDGAVHPGVMYTDNGFWDTYRTVYPFFSLFCPERLGEIINGWVNAYRESGWFPTWPSPGQRDCMIGTHIDAILADALVKGIPGIDWNTAYQGLRRHSLRDEKCPYHSGRAGMEEYVALGYVPADRGIHAATSRTLDYAYNDFCVAQVARALGRNEDAARLLSRAVNAYRNVFDPAVGFMRGRCADGHWKEPFDAFEWGGAFVEGGAWQHLWSVPHDPAGLIALMGGADKFVARLDKMLALPPYFTSGSYGQEIHEMTEMAVAAFGQYAHSNQPVHHALYLYTCAGRPERTQFWVRRVLDELYGPDPMEGFAGDEDNGEMSAWYLLSAMGFYQICPGHPSYVVGSPLFPLLKMRREDGTTLTIHAENHAPENVYVHKVALNGEPVSGLRLAHDKLSGNNSGGNGSSSSNDTELSFTLSPVPPEPREYKDSELPFSLSRS